MNTTEIHKEQIKIGGNNLSYVRSGRFKDIWQVLV